MRAQHFLLVVLAALLAATASFATLSWQFVLAPRVESLVDSNGDQDGQLDTNETAVLVLSLSNKSDRPARNFSVRLSAVDGKLDALSPAVQHVTALAPGASVTLAPIQLHVSARADRGGPAVVCQNPGPGGTCSNFVVVAGGCTSDAQCRLSSTQDYAAGIRLEIRDTVTAYMYSFARRFSFAPESVVFDLDLNSAYPAQPTTTFAEGFESSFGNFTLMNLDAGITSNSASNGARCQYNDPDFPNSNSYGDSECYLGLHQGQAPVNDWHIHGTTADDGGRAFLGTASLHYGKHSGGNPALDTIGLSQMDAIRTKAYIPLSSRVCRDDPSPNARSCVSDADCAVTGGGPCVPAAPVLSFKQQVSLDDGHCLSSLGLAFERAVVQVQVLGSATWQKPFPFTNVYDAQGDFNLSNCTFDPTDDGNTEDDLFDPLPSYYPTGPSSTCYPEFVFASQGDTDAPFSPSNTGSASDGPGLAGSAGSGTWVESRFDLSRYRGRSIRLRFLLTTFKVSDSPDVESVLMWNPTPCDDGWYVDDVRLTGTLGTATPTVSTDAADNSSLPGAADADGDGRPDDFDCAPSDAEAFAVPSEVFTLRPLNDDETFRWEAAAPFAGSGTVHDVLRGLLGEWPVGSGAGESCVAAGVAGNQASDPAIPNAGGGYWYLVRARNACGAGNYGFNSQGAARGGAACP